MLNIFAHIPPNLPEELFETLYQKTGVKIERIVSKGHATPSSAWYDQDWDEWVILLQGSAVLQFADDVYYHLKPGDYCLIPAHRKHRVSQTDSTIETVWLAIHLH
jgi:cupin 2 domain-containing protein